MEKGTCMPNQPEFKINWSGRGHSYTQEDINSVIEAMKADPLTQGKYLAQFESDFCKFNGSKHAFAVSNCTNALDLSATLSKLKKGDEVIIPAHTYCASAIPFGRTGAKIVWADVDPGTFEISADSIKKNLTPKTKVIVVVHLYGLMADMGPIMELAQEHKLIVVEDCAQSIGAEYKGHRCGTFGDFGCFSFHTAKNMTTLGEGGILTVKNSDMAKLVLGLRFNGIRPFPEGREQYWIPTMSDVDLDLDGVWPFNYCLGEPQCAVGSNILKRIDEMTKLRQERASKFINAVKDYPELCFQKVSKDFTHVRHLFPAKYDGKALGKGKTRDDFIKIMAYKHKVKVIVQYYPLYRYPLFKKMGIGKANCPNTDEFYDNMVSFPFHLWMSDADLNYMIDKTIETLKELRK